jgi:ERCC4-type nuclease
MKKENDFTIIVDTREQHPWIFPDHATSKKKLDTGDYSIEGLEDLLCIERKNGIAEIANNMTEDRFVDVIARMSLCKYSFLLIESDYTELMNYPVGSDVPVRAWKNIKISPGFILKFLMELTINHNIHVMFCGNPTWAEKTALSIMKRIYKKHGKT